MLAIGSGNLTDLFLWPHNIHIKALWQSSKLKNKAFMFGLCACSMVGLESFLGNYQNQCVVVF